VMNHPNDLHSSHSSLLVCLSLDRRKKLSLLLSSLALKHVIIQSIKICNSAPSIWLLNSAPCCWNLSHLCIDELLHLPRSSGIRMIRNGWKGSWTLQRKKHGETASGWQEIFWFSIWKRPPFENPCYWHPSWSRSSRFRPLKCLMNFSDATAEATNRGNLPAPNLGNLRKGDGKAILARHAKDTMSDRR